MILATRKMTFQINDNEFETITDGKTFDENTSFGELKKWYDKGNKEYHFYASPIIQIQFLKDKD